MLERYLEELKRISLLTPEEERTLWKAYKDDGDMASRRKLIEQYQPLVFKEAMRWHIRADLLPDAVQICCPTPCRKGRSASSKPSSALTTGAMWPFLCLPYTVSGEKSLTT